MAAPTIVEGTGEEIAAQLKRQPNQRFRLVPLVDTRETAIPRNTALSPQERIRALDELAALNTGLPILTDEAFDRERLAEARL